MDRPGGAGLGRFDPARACTGEAQHPRRDEAMMWHSVERDGAINRHNTSGNSDDLGRGITTSRAAPSADYCPLGPPWPPESSPVPSNSRHSDTPGPSASARRTPSTSGISRALRPLAVLLVAGAALLGTAPLAWAQNPPTEPRNVRAVPGDGVIQLQWDAPSSHGSSVLKGVRVPAIQSQRGPGDTHPGPVRHGTRDGEPHQRHRVLIHLWATNSAGFSAITTASAVPKAQARVSMRVGGITRVRRLGQGKGPGIRLPGAGLIFSSGNGRK